MCGVPQARRSSTHKAHAALLAAGVVLPGLSPQGGKQPQSWLCSRILLCACCQPASAAWLRYTAALVHLAWRAVITCPYTGYLKFTACCGVQDAESPPTSDLEQQLLTYVKALRLPGTAGADVLAMITRHDLSSAKGHLVTSIPGRHKGKLLEWQPTDTQCLSHQSCLRQALSPHKLCTTVPATQCVVLTHC